jgi:membrane protein YqaA with SNARE-associated domain
VSDRTATTNGPSDTIATQPVWANWLTGRPGVALAFLWGFAEGTLFFVVPDVVISLAALLKPRSAWRHILAAIAGAAIAGMLLFNWSSSNPQSAHQAVARVPFVTARMFTHVQTSYQRHGLGALLLGPLSGTPYKIYAVEAPAFMSASTFLWGTIPARGERFLLVWGACALFGFLFRRAGKGSPSQMVLWHGSFWVILYVFYWGRIVFE